MKVKTRFAPSPTGFLHVGGVRTALYSWLFAKHHQGEFILRIEDTDQERSTEESIQAILEGMHWLGLDYQGEPIFQTARYARYQQAAQQLLAQGHAYLCDCTKERLENLRAAQIAAKEKPRYDGHCLTRQVNPQHTHVVRFKNPQEGEVAFKDAVYGEITVQNKQLDDLILIRSDGHPTYNFAVVVDDWDMAITHIIRGDDHINNTPRQINLYQAFNAPIPVFAHLPMILGEDGKRLSKRHGAVSVLEFKEQGIAAQALLNYLVRLGWSHGDQEIFSLAEMIQFFDLNHVSRGVSSFNYEKLYWLNQHYLKTTDPDALAPLLQEAFTNINIVTNEGPSLAEVIALQADRCKTFNEMAEKSVYFYQDSIVYDEEVVKKQLKPGIEQPLRRLAEYLAQEECWQKERLHALIHQVCEEFNIGMGKLGQPLRAAITGGSNSPSLDATLALIGKKRVLARIEQALAHIQSACSG